MALRFRDQLTFKAAFGGATVDLDILLSLTDSNAGTNTCAFDAAQGTAVGITLLATGHTGTVTYDLTNSDGGAFAVNSSTGVVSVGAVAPTAGTRSITGRATSASGQTISANFSITVTSSTLISESLFESPSVPSGYGAQYGGTISISTDTGLNYNASAGSIKGTYPIPGGGGVFVYGGPDLAAHGLSDIYIDFWAKMPSATKHGVKFLKVFGGNNGGYANTTFGLDYNGNDNGMMYQVSFGDGSATENDTAHVIHLDGGLPALIGRSYGTATVLTPQGVNWVSTNWGTSWHHFRFRCKFNSGTTAANEVADGAYYVEIDDVVYVNATGLFNRHYSNPPIDRLELFGWSQNGSAPFEIWYDSLKISTGGFM